MAFHGPDKQAMSAPASAPATATLRALVFLRGTSGLSKGRSSLGRDACIAPGRNIITRHDHLIDLISLK